MDADIAINGVRFIWSMSEEPQECMNRAEAILEDDCHKVEAVLEVCAREIGWALVLSIDGHKFPPSNIVVRDRQEWRNKLHTGMQAAAEKMHDALRRKQEDTRQLMEFRSRRVESSKGIHGFLLDLAHNPIQTGGK